MIIFLIVFFALLVAGCATMSYYAPVVPLLGVLLKPLIIVCVVVGVVLVIFVVIEIYNKVKKR